MKLFTRTLGILRRLHHAEVCDEHDTVVDWVDAYNDGVDPLPPHPNLKHRKTSSFRHDRARGLTFHREAFRALTGPYLFRGAGSR